VPFPSVTPTPNAGDGTYIVQENDTLGFIAQKFGVSVDELAQANNLSETNFIVVGQQLTIPGAGNVQSDIGQRFEGLRGTVSVEIYQDKDGNQHIQNAFMGLNNDGSSQLYFLDGVDLQAYQNKVLKITGTLDHIDDNFNPVIKVDQFQDPYPNAQFEILRGTQYISQVNGQDVTIFITNDGRTFAELNPYGEVFAAMFGDIHGKESQLEVLILPDEYVGDYPALRVFSGLPVTDTQEELQITANQIPIIEESLNINNQESYTPPALTLEKVELMYFVTNPHWQVDHLDGGTLYLQPVWRFYGHFDSGGEFEVLVQAFKQEYLLPELDPFIPGG
jgi:LysM repeat protein